MSKAIVMTETGGPEVLKLRAVPMPVPGPEQVGVAVNSMRHCLIELHVMSWRPAYAVRMHRWCLP